MISVALFGNTVVCALFLTAHGVAHLFAARAVQGLAVGVATTLVRRSTDAALLVLGSRGHGAFVGMLIGSVSQYCVTHAHCPVVVLRGPEG